MESERITKSPAVCPKCGGDKLISVDGQWIPCICALKEKIKHKLQPLFPAPKPTAGLIEKVKVASKIMERHDNSRRFVVENLKRNFYRTYLISLLTSTRLVFDVSIINTNYLIDLFVGSVEDQSMYDYHTETCVLIHGIPDTGNRQELNIISKFIEIHHDKRIIFYSKSREYVAKFKPFLIDSGFIVI